MNLIPYFDLMRESKDPQYFRLKMAHYAQEHGIKPAAQRDEVIRAKRRLQRLKCDAQLTASEKAIRRICREEGWLNHQRRKHRTSRICAPLKPNGSSLSKPMSIPKI
jgi:hypothetical protein